MDFEEMFCNGHLYVVLLFSVKMCVVALVS